MTAGSEITFAYFDTPFSVKNLGTNIYSSIALNTDFNIYTVNHFIVHMRYAGAYDSVCGYVF
jgi:hypothetical protein